MPAVTAHVVLDHITASKLTPAIKELMGLENLHIGISSHRQRLSASGTVQDVLAS